MVSNAVHLVFADMDDKGYSIEKLHEHATIQINDTHPTLVIPELVRQLMARGISIDAAIEIVKKTVAYTNHTILAEALEKWPLRYLKKVLTQELIDIIRYLDVKVKLEHIDEKLSIIDDQSIVHMAHMSIHYSFSVNGVAALHTEILKNDELKHFNDIYPNKFNNKTNGITFRRWLLQSNPELTKYLESVIGDSFKAKATDLEKLLKFDNDDTLKTLEDIKKLKKRSLLNLLKSTMV